MLRDSGKAIGIIQREAAPIRAGEIADLDPLIDLMDNARFVLIGEASHGTHEFYKERAQITKRLILEKKFSAVAVEADFPDAYRVNRYVRNQGDDKDASEALDGFRRFPQWMWRNSEVLEFVEWLRAHNDGLPDDSQKVGFYGLDLYSLSTSIEAILGYLEKVDPAGATRAKERYSCFDHFGEDTQEYGYAAAFGLAESCENDVIAQLVELNHRAAELAARDGRVAREDFFFARENARLVQNAEAYYRTMYRSDVSSWNLRDQHMAESLSSLEEHLSGDLEKPAKVAIWAHNSHLGDARATDMAARGELNVGQLIRQKYGSDSISIGFTTYHGAVTASTDWGGSAERKRVRPALAGSIEDLFHAAQIERFVLSLRGLTGRVLSEPLLQRAIGVIYRPETERQSHYFRARLGQQFDAVIHIDETHAVEPLETTATWEEGEAPETYPWGV